MNELRNRVKCSGLLWFLVAVIVWSESARAATSNNVQRCCPPGYVFVVLADGVEESGDLFPHRFRCHDRRHSGVEESRLFGYNFDVTNETMGIPQCSEVVMTQLGSVSDLLSTETCVDDLEGQAIVLRCKDDPVSIDVHRVLKCCPEGSAYDLDNRSCVFNDQQIEDVFKHLAGQSVILFEVGRPQCLDNEEVFIEYLSETHHLRLHQSSVDVVSVKHELSEHLAPHSFCLDGVQRQMPPTEHQFFTEPSAHPIIVRTCRPRSVCNRMPCVRRCCRNEQMLEERNGESVCVEHERNIRPTFYDLMYPLAADKPQIVAEPTGMNIHICLNTYKSMFTKLILINL